MDPVNARVLAAAQWLQEDDTAYEDQPDAALRAATEMLKAADAVDPLRMPPAIPPSIIERYIPGAIEIDESDIVEFTSLEELVAIPFVAAFLQEPGFHRLSRESWGSQWLLMAEYDEGRQWRVIGLITGPTPDLPVWEPVRTTMAQGVNSQNP